MTLGHFLSFPSALPDLLASVSQSLQEEPTSMSSQLTELMMASRTTLTSDLPRDLPSDAVISKGSFVINLEGKDDQLTAEYSFHCSVCV